MAFQPLGIGTGSLVAQRYEIARQLGAGAMSAVYVVRDRELGKQEYALKILQGPAAENAVDVERFRQEVVLTRRLTHQNIVRTFEFGAISSTQYFMVMELIDGRTLEELIDSRGELTFDKIVDYLSQVAEALAYAHQAGIVHRDLKPANILVSSEGTAKVADFGLAFHAELRMHLTQPGQTVGTPAYMAPERLAGEVTDPRSDIYSFGIIAYELITGDCPFFATDWYQLAQQVTNNHVPLLRKATGVPGWYDELIQKCVAKDPKNRFASADELHDFLLNKRGQAKLITLKRKATRGGNGRVVGGAPGWMLSVAGRPSVLAVLVATMLLLFIGNLLRPAKSRDTVAQNVGGGAKLISDFANSLEKLNKAVIKTYENKDKIDSMLQKIEDEESIKGQKTLVLESNPEDLIPEADRNPAPRAAAQQPGASTPVAGGQGETQLANQTAAAPAEPSASPAPTAKPKKAKTPAAQTPAAQSSAANSKAPTAVAQPTDRTR